MSRSYSVFVDNKYYDDFLVLYNSWNYYENKIPLKVYIANNALSLENRSNLEKKVEVVDVSIGSYSQHHFNGKYLFKWIGLVNHMADSEILLDADTMFLSNMDYLFDYIADGKLIGARENSDVYHKVYTDTWETEHPRIQSELRKYIGDKANNYTTDLSTPTYNAGLIGFSKKHHKFLLEKCIEILISDFDAKKNPISHLEQYMMNLLLQLYSIDIHVLPQLEWMNTWWFHKTPKKIIKIDDGKLTLYNEGGNRINFYHFTGGIGMPYGDNGLLYSCRPHQLYKSQEYEPQFKREDVEKLWYEVHETPVLLLYEFFHNKGF